MIWYKLFRGDIFINNGGKYEKQKDENKKN
mgnify:CR=1 FL=1